MERSPGEEPIVEVGDDGLRHSERKTRRRLVQSKLFPGGSQENNGVDDCDGDEESEEDDGEEFGGKKSKSKKRKRTAPKKTPRKVQVMNKKATGAKNGCLSVTFRSDFFVKVSERKSQMKQERMQLEMVDLTAENDKHDKNLQLLTGEKCEKQMKEKADGNAKSCKNKAPEASKSPLRRRKVKDNKSNVADGLSTPSASVPPIASDLRLEAKIVSEEYARISAGRQTHPFFSSWKEARRSQEPTEITATVSKWCSFAQGDEITCCPPVHVFEALQDDLASTDWKDWEFCERNLFHSSGYKYTGHACSTASVGSVGPLKFDSFVAISSSNHIPFLREVGHLDNLPNQRKNTLSISANGCSMLADGEEAHEPLLTYLKDHENKKNGCVGGTEDQRMIRFLRERLFSCRSHCCDRADSSLWTNKYQPQNASEVCSNGESVKFLSDWLRSWNETVPQSSKHSTCDDSDIEESDSWCQNDSDTENTDAGSASRNVLLITGPVGSGKSAAVYACAKEQGFDVIEVNSSDWRNGANVKQKFGEAMESHGFNRWSFEGHVLSQRKRNVDLFSHLNSTASQESDCQIIDVISTTCRQKPVDVLEQLENTTKKKTTSSQGAHKTLVLFEDVDIIFDEDKGFIATLLQLAETAKRPIILTSNSKNPVLPRLLTMQVVEFRLSSLLNLLSAVYMVCVAEKVDIPLQLIERFVRCCKYDLRKTIMLLQFWCQGRRFQEASQDWKMQWMYSPLQFDIDAAHQIMPKVFPWGFPWELSTLVDYEVSQALSLVKDGELNYTVMLDDSDKDNNETDIKARKEAMLRNCLDNDIGGSAGQFDYVGDFATASESPVTFTRRTARRKRNAVLYSDSEDDTFCTDNLPAISEIPLEDHDCEASPDVSAVPLSRLSSPGNFELSTGQMFYPNGCDIDQELLRNPETLSDPLLCDTYKLVDISHVPESALVPEDEVNSGNGCPSGIVSLGHFSLQEDSLTGMKAIQSLAAAETVNVDNSVAKPVSSFTELDSESVHENEELEDSQGEVAETVTTVYPVTDECSRADFRFGCASMESPPCPHIVDQVQQTWRKLLGCHEELKSHITAEQKDSLQIVEFASRMSNLISEADLMFSGCQLLTSDSLDAVAVPSVEPAAVCWYDEQVEMTSTFAQHGFCFYAKKTAAVASNLGHKNQLDLSLEMLTTSNNIMALGKLVRKETSKSKILSNLPLEPPQIDIFSRREVELRPYGTILSVVPAKSQMALTGATLHEYLSSLSLISKSEASRLLESAREKRQQRRGRGFRHYLNGGSFALSPEEAKLLAQYGCYGEAASGGG